MDMSKRSPSEGTRVPGHRPGLEARQTSVVRVFQHPRARIKPLDASTMREASTCLVYENGHAVAQLKRCGQRCWSVYPTGTTIPATFGASALEAVTTWLGVREGATA